MKKFICILLSFIVIISLFGCSVFKREDKEGKEYYNNLKTFVAKYNTAMENFNKELSKQSKNANKIADALIKESDNIINLKAPKDYENIHKYYSDMATYSKQMAKTYKKYVAEKDELKKINYMEDIKELSKKRDEVVTKLQNLQKNITNEDK